MTPRAKQRLLRDIILGETQAVAQPKAVLPQPKPNKLHLNIMKPINFIYTKIKGAIFPVKGKQTTVGGTHTNFADVLDIVKFVVGYGIIGGFVLTLVIMLLPYNLPPLTSWLRGSGITEITIIVLGMGCLIYLWMDLKEDNKAKNLYADYLKYRGSK